MFGLLTRRIKPAALPTTVQGAAIDLVRRARVGDQNAVAMLIMVKKSAGMGSKRAKEALKVITEYIKSHPVNGKCKVGFGCTPATQRVINRLHSQIGAEPQTYVLAIIDAIPQIPDASHAAVSLANLGDLLRDKKGKSWARTQDDNPRIKGMLNKLKPECRAAFLHGMQSCGKPLHKIIVPNDRGLQDAMHLGRSVGIARKIQAVRLPEVPISAISPMAAWELGEE